MSDTAEKQGYLGDEAQVEAEKMHGTIEEIMLKTAYVAEKDKEIGVLEAIRRYPKEIFWSVVFSMGLIMAGYDAQIISSLFGLPSFNQRFGTIQPDGTYSVSAAWQTALTMGTPIGQITILFFAYPLEWFGRKKTYAVTVACCLGLVFMQFFAPSLSVLCAGEIIAGILWGGCVLMAPTYASEITHTSLRGILEAGNNLGFLSGQFIANGVMDAMSTRTDEWAYKIPFGVQWIWPLVILSLISFAPESPYWLVRQGKFEECKAALRKLSSKSESEEAIEERLILIKETDALEREMDQTTSYWEIFKGTNSYRTEICSMVYCIQIFSGIPLCMNYSTYFFEQAGLAATDAFSLSLGSTAIGFTFTCISWVVLSWVGRRTIYNFGMVCSTLLLFVIGFLDIAPNYDTNANVRWAQAVIVLIWSAIWQMSLGPIVFVLIGEVPSTRLRGKTIAFATAMQSVTALVFTIIMPYMLNPTAANLRGKAGFLFAGLSLICCVWSYFRLPETRNRTFDEIDIMFHKKIPARKFASFQIGAHNEMSTDV